MKKTVELIIKNALPISSIAHKVNHLRAINQYLQTILPLDLYSHCQVANLNQHCLVIQVDNAHWLTTLRFNSPDLLKKLKASYPDIQTLKFLVVPVTTLAKSLPPVKLSSEAAKTIASYAKGVEDSSLQQALIRLASRGK